MVAATNEFVAHAGEVAAGNAAVPNRLVVDGKAGKVRIEGKTTAEVVIGDAARVTVAAGQVRMMNNVIVKDEKTTFSKDVTMKGNLDMA